MRPEAGARPASPSLGGKDGAVYLLNRDDRSVTVSLSRHTSPGLSSLPLIG